MADDDSVQPVTRHLVDEPVDPSSLQRRPRVDPLRRPPVPPSGSVPPSTVPPGAAELATSVVRAQITPGAAAEPRGVEVRAAVHDAAVHGDGIARAIEASQRGGDPRSINQQLGGAAASAASGQTARIEPSHRIDDSSEASGLDPLAATERIGDDDPRRHRQQHESELSAAVEEDRIEQAIEDDG